MNQIRFKLLLAFAVLFCSFSPPVKADGYLNAEQTSVARLALVLDQYMQASSDQVPDNLAPLTGYADLSKFLDGSFPRKFAFLSGKPKADLPGVGEVEVLLVKTRPESNGTRLAIWRTEDQRLDAGFLNDAQLRRKLPEVSWASLKPMGGTLLASAPTESAPVAQDGQSSDQSYIAEPMPPASQPVAEPALPAETPVETAALPSESPAAPEQVAAAESPTPVPTPVHREPEPLPTAMSPTESSTSTPELAAQSGEEQKSGSSFPFLPIAVVLMLAVAGVAVFALTRR